METAQKARARVTNGTLFANTLDIRTATGRRIRDLVEIYSAPWGGLNNIEDEHSRQLVRRVATLSCQAEALETRMAEGAQIDPLDYSEIANRLEKLLDKLNWRAARARPKRRPKQRRESHLADAVFDDLRMSLSPRERRILDGEEQDEAGDE
jgi:hypothetical protein